MSSRNGDKSRFNRLRKQKIHQRAAVKAIRTSPRPSTAKPQLKRSQS